MRREDVAALEHILVGGFAPERITHCRNGAAYLSERAGVEMLNGQ